MNVKYYLGALLSIPLLPLMYLQGKRIRKSVPKLPEATGSEGFVPNGNSTLKLITIGESTIAGVGVETHEEGISGALAKELARCINRSVTWTVYAKSGYTSKMVTKKLLPNIQEDTADLIVIGLGGNDAFTLNSPAKWRKDSRELIEALRAKFPSTPIFFLNMPPIKSFPAFTSLIRFTLGNLVEILGAELSKIVKDYPNVYYYSRVITLEDWIKRLKINKALEHFFSDGVHPSKLTYQTWAKDAVEYICLLNLFEKESHDQNRPI